MRVLLKMQEDGLIAFNSASEEDVITAAEAIVSLLYKVPPLYDILEAILSNKATIADIINSSTTKEFSSRESFDAMLQDITPVENSNIPQQFKGMLDETK